jgi:hypothetical protein
MKKLLITILFAIASISCSETCNETINSVKDVQELFQQGCCSYHNGVCGCEFGRVKCCDGSYSPSCRC